MEREIILASASPRRIEMMRRHGFDPVIRPADIDETLPDGLSMEDSVKLLAEKKARAIAKTASYGSVVIAADTLVYKDGIMGKPASRQDAFTMLSKIRNTSHFVATGVAILIAGTSYENIFCDVTEVFCKDFSDDELNDYLDTDEPYDKAGAYAIQGIFSKYIDHYEGSFDTVVGFPWTPIEEILSTIL